MYSGRCGVKEVGGATPGRPARWQTNGRAPLQGACLALEVVGRLASAGPMSTVAAVEGVVCGGRGGRGGRGGGGVRTLGGAGGPISW